MIQSARRIVARRCAMVRVVESERMTFWRASLTRNSEFASRALVASSRIRISGFRMRARAIAIRYVGQRRVHMGWLNLFLSSGKLSASGTYFCV